LSTHLRLRLSTNILHAFLFSLFMLHVLPISSSLTWSFLLYLKKSTNYEAYQYAVFSNLPSLHPSSIPISSQHPVLKYPRSMFLLMSETKIHTHTHRSTENWDINRFVK
jgi:hypothetical protein